MEKSKKAGTKRTVEAKKEINVTKATEEVIKDEFADEDFLGNEDFLDDEDFLIEDTAKEDDIKAWYYIDEDEITGAFTKKEMQEMYHNGTIKAITEVWNKTMSDWTELKHTELYEKKSIVQKKVILPIREKRKFNPLILWGAGGILLVVILISVGFLFMNNKAKADAEKAAISDQITTTPDTANEKGITVKKIIEKYMTDPQYDLKDDKNKESILTVTGKLNYEGKKQDAILKFRVKSDGSVHFEQMSFHGEVQSEAVYQELVKGMKAN